MYIYSVLQIDSELTIIPNTRQILYTLSCSIYNTSKFFSNCMKLKLPIPPPYIWHTINFEKRERTKKGQHVLPCLFWVQDPLSLFSNSWEMLHLQALVSNTDM